MFIINSITGEILLYSYYTYYIGIKILKLSNFIKFVEENEKDDNTLLFTDIVYKILPSKHCVILKGNNIYLSFDYISTNSYILNNELVPNIINAENDIVYTPTGIYKYDGSLIFKYNNYIESFGNIFKFDDNKTGIIRNNKVEIIENVKEIYYEFIVTNDNKIYKNYIYNLKEISFEDFSSNAGYIILQFHYEYNKYLLEELNIDINKIIPFKYVNYYFSLDTKQIIQIFNEYAKIVDIPDDFIVPDLLKVIPNRIKSTRD